MTKFVKLYEVFPNYGNKEESRQEPIYVNPFYVVSLSLDKSRNITYLTMRDSGEEGNYTIKVKGNLKTISKLLEGFNV